MEKGREERGEGREARSRAARSLLCFYSLSSIPSPLYSTCGAEFWPGCDVSCGRSCVGPFQLLWYPLSAPYKAKKVKSSAEQGPPTLPSRFRQAMSITATPFGGKGSVWNGLARIRDSDSQGNFRSDECWPSPPHGRLSATIRFWPPPILERAPVDVLP
jgi:hypothetical protein